MRMLNPSLAVASLLGFLTAASCTLITDVDRTKIPTDGGAHAGETGTGGGAGDTGSGGNGNEGGNGATGGSSGGRGGSAGSGNGGTSGTDAGAGGNDAGSGGSSTPTEVCDKAEGTITIGLGTLIDATGATFTIGDGVNDKVTFEFDWQDDSTTVDPDGIQVIEFSGTPTEAELAVLITDAINAAPDLDVTATTTAGGGNNGGGNAGAGGEAGNGASGASTGGQGGEAGAVAPPAPMAETVTLVNDHAGARGNLKITEKIGNPNFTVSGMSGGSAVACSGDASCSGDAECDSARTCGSDNLCE